MATYKDLQDRINLDYLNNMSMLSETKRAIRTSISRYENRRYWFNETATALATVASQSYVLLPSDFLQLDRLEVIVNGYSDLLIETDFGQIRAMNATTNNPSTPTHYNYRGDRINLACIPNSAYSITCYYVHKFPDLSAEADSNPWTNEAVNLIAHCAAIELMTGILQIDDDRKLGRHYRAIKDAEDELSLRNASRFPGKLRATTF